MGDELKPRQARFAAALLVARSVAEASELVGVSERTGRRWVELPQVRDALHAAESEAMDAAVRRAVGGMGAAVDALLEVCRDGDVPPGARVSAARTLLDAAVRLWEARELDERVTLLEVRVSEARR